MCVYLMRGRAQRLLSWVSAATLAASYGSFDDDEEEDEDEDLDLISEPENF